MKPPVMEEERREKSDSQIQHEKKVFGDDFERPAGLPEDAVLMGEQDYTEDGNGNLVQVPNYPDQYQPAPGHVMPMFCTPFLRGQLQLDTEEVAQSCRDLVSKVEQGKIESEYTTYFNEEIRVSMHETEWFKSFSNQIKDSYIAFISNQFMQPVGHLCRDDIHLFAWVNVYKGSHQHTTHNHVNSHISGTYYVKDDSKQPIKFLSPNVIGNANHGAVDRPIQREGYPNIVFDGVEGVDSSFQYYPVESEFLFWPSYILHSVEPAYDVPEDYERISISFNLKHRQIIDNNETGENMTYDFLEEEVGHERMVGYNKDE